MSTSTSGITATLILRAPRGKATTQAHDAAAGHAAPAHATPAHTSAKPPAAHPATAHPATAHPAAAKPAPQHADPPPPARPGAKIELVTQAQLHAVMPNLAGSKVAQYIGPLNSAMAEGHIDNRLRICAFLGQVAHESGELAWFHEFASGWEYDITRNPSLARELGNTQPGDGPRYKGRGPIQLTGRNNYIACGKALGVDLVDHPDLAVQPSIAFRTAVWYWTTHGLNALADQGDYRTITRRINGGYNGYADRVKYYERALAVFPAKAHA